MTNKKAPKSTADIPARCDVDLERYLGKWYEIARFPHVFEKDLINVTAEYSIKDNGKIEVKNSGEKNGKRNVAKAGAWLAEANCSGRFFVRFFWPFKSEYKIIKLDEENYTFAVVTSSSRDYLWILCREPQMSEELYGSLVSFAADQGFDISKIIKVNQNGNLS